MSDQDSAKMVKAILKCLNQSTAIDASSHSSNITTLNIAASERANSQVPSTCNVYIERAIFTGKMNIFNGPLINSNNSGVGSVNQPNQMRATSQAPLTSNVYIEHATFTGNINFNGPLINSNNSGVGSVNQANQIRTYSTTVTAKATTERMIKIESVIVNVLMRAKKLSSVGEVMQLSKLALVTAPFVPIKEITIKEVCMALQKLIDLKYIKRNQDGSFEFLVD